MMMNTLRLGGALVLASALLVAATPAAQGVVGTWKATFAQAVRVNTDGRVEVQKWGAATLALRQSGDSLLGTWTTNVAGEVTWSVHGTLRDGRLRLEATARQAARAPMSAQLAQVESMHWDGTVQGGRIQGEMWLVFVRSARAPVKTPWRAERVTK